MPAAKPALNDPQERAFATCRSMGHEWHHHGAIGTDDTNDRFRRPFGGNTGMVGLPSHCGTCGMDRVRWVTRSGEVITRYEQPQGYARHGDDRLTPQEWRSSYVAALFDDFSSAVNRGRRPAAKRRAS